MLYSYFRLFIDSYLADKVKQKQMDQAALDQGLDPSIEKAVSTIALPSFKEAFFLSMKISIGFFAVVEIGKFFFPEGFKAKEKNKKA